MPDLIRVLPESLVYESGLLGPVPKMLAAPTGEDGYVVHNAINYLPNILSSKVYDVAIQTPLDYSTRLSERLGVHFWFKREDLQPEVSLFFFFPG